MQGRIVQNQNFKETTEALTLGLNNLPQGMYIMQINFSDGKIEQRKLIIKSM